MEKRILVVDDDVEVRSRLYELLFSLGHAITCVPTGKEAFAYLTEKHFDLILLDTRLPDMRGVEAVERIRSFDENVLIILLSEAESKDEEVMPEGLGIHAVVAKDFSRHLMMKYILEVLRSQPEDTEKDVSTAMTGKGRILVVDDQEEVRGTLVKFLGRRGYNVRAAVSGEDALMKIKLEKPHIVLSDMRMPGMDGIMLLQQIRRLDESIRVVMLTSAQDDFLIEEATRLGACDYLPKPFDLFKLDAILTALILQM